MFKIELTDAIKSINPKKLRREDLATFGFSEINDILKDFLDFFSFFTDPKVFAFISVKQKELEGALENFLNLINSIQTFDPNATDNPSQARNTIIENANRQWVNFFNSFNSLYVYAQLKSKKLDDVESQAKETKKDLDSILINAEIKNKEIDKIIKNINEEAEKTRKEIQKIRNDTQEFSAKDVVTNYSKIFSDQADVHEKKANFWWRAIIALVLTEAILAIVLIFIYQRYFLGLDTTSSLSIAITKLFILSVGFLFIAQAIKSFNANNHLAVLNRHRCNALSSFKAFLDATDDPQVKDALIVQVSKSIYDPNISGYLSKDDSSSSFNSIEIIKNIIDGAKK